MGLKQIPRILNKRIDNVVVDIHVVGKYPFGECIFFILKINGIVEFSVIIDSCEKDIDILKNQLIPKYEIKVVDLVCWTHPHEDHSLGMIKILKEYCNKNTLIVEPVEIGMSKEYFDDESKEIYNYLNGINRKNKKRNGSIALATESKELVSIKYIYDSLNELNLNIETYSPIDEKVNNIRTNKTKNMNDYSILMCINIDNWKFIFSSDIEDSSIKYIKEKYEKFYNVIFLKIPHHGSKSSEDFINLIDEENENDIICNTTVYNKGDIILPELEVLDKYKNSFKSHVFCTNKNSDLKENYGIISTRYELHNHQYLWDCNLKGEAYEY